MENRILYCIIQGKKKLQHTISRIENLAHTVKHR